MNFFSKPIKPFFIHWFKKSVLILMTVLSVLLLSLMLILGTQPGTQWLFALINSYSEEVFHFQFSYQQLDGSLLDAIYFKDLEYQDSEFQFNVSHFKLSWHPEKLLQKRLYIEQIALDGIQIETKTNPENARSDSNGDPDTAPQPQQSLSLNDINLPVDVVVNEIKLSAIRIITRSDKAPLLIDSLTVKAHLRNLLSELTWAGQVDIQEIPVRLLDNSIEKKETTFDLSLVGEGDLKQLILRPLQVNLADGDVMLTGKIGWLPELSWDLKLDTHNIDPALVYSQWPGNINLEVASRGRKKMPDEKTKNNNNYELELVLHHLQGTLLGQELSGNGRFKILDDVIQVQHFQLASGEAKINVDGRIEQKLDLKWQINIPEMENLVPDNMQAQFQAKNIGLNRIKPLLPAEINELSSEINVDAQLTMQQKLKANVTIILTPGIVSYMLEPHKQIDITGQLHSGKGNITLNGELSLDANQNWPVKLHVQGKNFQIINIPELQAIVSPDLVLEHGAGGAKIKGLLDIPKARIFLNELPEESKTVSDDAVVIGEETAQPANIELDMGVKLGNDIHLKAFGLDAWLNGQMHIKKSPGQLANANGELRTTHGTFRAYGQNLTIEQARISYAGGYLDDPGLNIRASKEVQGVTVGVMATGTVTDLDVGTYSSDSGLNSKDIVSLLLTGQKFDNADTARIYAGTELSDELSVGVNTGVGDEASELVVRYKLLKNMHFEGLSSAKKSGGNLIYTIEFE